MKEAAKHIGQAQASFTFRTIITHVGFVPHDIYPWCKNHPGKDAHWRLAEPDKHRGDPSTFLCEECKTKLEGKTW